MPYNILAQRIIIISEVTIRLDATQLDALVNAAACLQTLITFYREHRALDHEARLIETIIALEPVQDLLNHLAALGDVSIQSPPPTPPPEPEPPDPPQQPAPQLLDKSLLDDYDWCHEHYIVQELGSVKIGRMLGCSANTVCTKLKALGIQVRPARRSKQPAAPTPPIPTPTPANPPPPLPARSPLPPPGRQHTVAAWLADILDDDEEGDDE